MCSCCIPICSECVDTAACNPTLCSSCLTGSNLPADFFCGTNENPVAGSPVDICLGCGPDVPGLSQGPAACQPPTSPLTEGTTDQPPAPACCAKAPPGGGSGAGSAPSASGGGRAASGGGAQPRAANLPPKVASTNSLLQKFGGMLASLGFGGQKTTLANAFPGQAVPKAAATSPISPNAFLLIIFIIGVLLLMLAFGHRE